MCCSEALHPDKMLPMLLFFFFIKLFQEEAGGLHFISSEEADRVLHSWSDVYMSSRNANTDLTHLPLHFLTTTSLSLHDVNSWKQQRPSAARSNAPNQSALWDMKVAGLQSSSVLFFLSRGRVLRDFPDIQT